MELKTRKPKSAWTTYGKVHVTSMLRELEANQGRFAEQMA